MPDPQLDIALVQLLLLQTLRLQREQEFAVKDSHQPRPPQPTTAPPTGKAEHSSQKRPTPWPHHRRFWHRKDRAREAQEQKQRPATVAGGVA